MMKKCKEERELYEIREKVDWFIIQKCRRQAEKGQKKERKYGEERGKGKLEETMKEIAKNYQKKTYILKQ